jgi:hypothetical protein
MSTPNFRKFVIPQSDSSQTYNARQFNHGISGERLMSKRTLTLIKGTALCLALAACSPEEEVPVPAPRGQTSTPVVNVFAENSPGLLTFPQLRESAPQMTCDHSDNIDLIGCYVVETCSSDAEGDQGDANDSYSWLYLLDITNKGTLEGRLMRYGTSAACQGNYIPVGMSALNLREMTTGTPFTGSNGVAITPINAAQVIAGFRTDYISSFYLANGRLCFAEGDFSWPDDMVLLFQNTTADERPTTINFSSCLLKLN